MPFTPTLKIPTLLLLGTLLCACSGNEPAGRSERAVTVTATTLQPQPWSDTVRALGFTDIALFLDDIPWQLQHPGDLAAFPDLVSAQLSLIRALETSTAAGRLAVCPTLYCGRGNEPYRRRSENNRRGRPGHRRRREA